MDWSYFIYFAAPTLFCRLDRVWLGYILRFYHRDVDLVGEAALAHDGRDSSMVFFFLAGGGRDHLCPLAV